jgi:hypothetical protein
LPTAFHKTSVTRIPGARHVRSVPWPKAQNWRLFFTRLNVCPNAWLTWEDSNRHIPDLKLPFEISEEFQTFSRQFRPETFGTILPLSGYMETGSKNLVWYLVCARVLRLLKGQY